MTRLIVSYRICMFISFGLLASIVADSFFSFVNGQTITPPAVGGNPLMSVMAGLAIELLQAIAPVLILWLTIRLRQWFGLQIDAKMRDSLQTALDNAAGRMVATAGSAAQALLIGSAMRNKALADGLAYVEQSAPDAIKHFALTRDALIDKLEAKLGLRVGATSEPSK